MKKFIMKHRIGLMLLALVAICSVFSISLGSIGLLGFAFAGVTTTDLTGGQAGVPANMTNRCFPLRKRITIPLALQIASDIVQLVNVKAGWLVKQVNIVMVTPTTGDALTANIGDATAAGYDAAMSLKGAAGTRTYGIDGTDAHITSGGKLYAADDTIDAAFVTVTNPAGDVVFDVIAEVVDTNA